MTAPGRQAGSDTLDVLALDQQLCFALYTASRLMTRAYRPLLAPLGLTYPQYLAMLALWEGDAPVALKDLGARLRLDSGTLTPLVKRLEASGWVTRARRAEDERVLEVSLTDTGRALRARAEAVPRALLCQSDASLPALVDLRGRLHALIEGLTDGLGAS